MKVKKAFDYLSEAKASLNTTTQIGLPFGKSYFKSTPKFWRVLGDSILGLGTVVTAISSLNHNPVLAVVAAGLGWLGKTITNGASIKE
jgi:hypothetical protein